MADVEVQSPEAGADKIIDAYGADRTYLIHVLQDVQEEFGYLPRPALERVAERLEVPLAEVLRVGTFYSAFSLEPRGEHIITVCMGTACHVKGSPRIMDAVRRALGLREGRQTTDDMKFTVQGVRCIGCCGLAPVITIDGTAYGRLTLDKIPEILKKYE